MFVSSERPAQLELGCILLLRHGARRRPHHPILKPRRERAVQPVGHGRAVIGQEVPEPEDASAVLVLDVPCKLHHLGHVPVREGQQRPCGGEARAALALAVAAAATKRRRDRRTDEGVLVHTAAPKRDVRQNVRLVGVVPAKWTAEQVLGSPRTSLQLSSDSQEMVRANEELHMHH
eukprot:4157975-Pleurochrysis_carterae.AAC.6